MITVNVSEIDGHLSEYLERVQRGETFVIVDSGKTLGQLSSVASQSLEPRPRGLYKGQFVVPDDFDDPLPEDILADFEGRD